MDKLVPRNPLDFNLLSTSPEIFIDQNIFFLTVHTLSHSTLTAVRQEVNSVDSSVVVQELEFAMN